MYESLLTYFLPPPRKKSKPTTHCLVYWIRQINANSSVFFLLCLPLYWLCVQFIWNLCFCCAVAVRGIDCTLWGKCLLFFCMLCRQTLLIFFFISLGGQSCRHTHYLIMFLTAITTNNCHMVFKCLRCKRKPKHTRKHK